MGTSICWPFERSPATYDIRLNHSERGCHPATVRVGRRVAAFNHQLRNNAAAVLMLNAFL
jgi:hypothetical protein